MKNILKGAAVSCAVIIAAAACAWGAGCCDWVTAAVVSLGAGLGLFLAVHELHAMYEWEQAEHEAARRSAYRAAFFREVNRL